MNIDFYINYKHKNLKKKLFEDINRLSKIINSKEASIQSQNEIYSIIEKDNIEIKNFLELLNNYGSNKLKFKIIQISLLVLVISILFSFIIL
jgi:hypothetical protein